MNDAEKRIAIAMIQAGMLHLEDARDLIEGTLPEDSDAVHSEAEEGDGGGDSSEDAGAEA